MMNEKQAHAPVRVSILVPVYNMETYLRECLDSLVGQTLREIEIVCVDDGSVDASAAILAGYAAKDPRVRVVTLPENKGGLVARRECIRHACGEYIMWVDPDDILERYACEELYAKITAAGVDIYQFRIRSFAADKASEKGLQSIDHYLWQHEGMLRDREILDKCFTESTYNYSLCNKIFRTEICKMAVPYIDDARVALGNDRVSYAMIAYFAHTYLGDDSRRIYYRYRYGCGVSTNSVCSLERFLHVYNSAEGAEKIRAFFTAVGSPDACREALDRIIEMRAQAMAAYFVKVKDEEKDEALARVIDSHGTEAALDLLLRAYRQNAAQLRTVYHSWNFRIGAAVTWLPRKLVRLIKKLRD